MKIKTAVIVSSSLLVSAFLLRNTNLPTEPVPSKPSVILLPEVVIYPKASKIFTSKTGRTFKYIKLKCDTARISVIINFDSTRLSANNKKVATVTDTSYEKRYAEDGKDITIVTKVKSGIATSYTKVSHNWGGVYFFKDGQPITEAMFDNSAGK